MTRLFTIFAVTAAAGSLLTSNWLAAQVSPTTARAPHVRITQGPDLESASEYLTIIRWTTNNPGGSPVHYGVVHYGVNPKDLKQISKSPSGIPRTLGRAQAGGNLLLYCGFGGVQWY